MTSSLEPHNFHLSDLEPRLNEVQWDFFDSNCSCRESRLVRDEIVQTPNYKYVLCGCVNTGAEREERKVHLCLIRDPVFVVDIILSNSPREPPCHLKLSCLRDPLDVPFWHNLLTFNSAAEIVVIILLKVSFKPKVELLELMSQHVDVSLKIKRHPWSSLCTVKVKHFLKLT